LGRRCDVYLLRYIYVHFNNIRIIRYDTHVLQLLRSICISSSIYTYI